MKKNTILLSTLLLSLTLVSCGEKNDLPDTKPDDKPQEEIKPDTPEVPEITEEEKQQAIYTTFKSTVMKEFAYRGSKTLKIDARVAGEPHVFDGETELTAEEIKALSITAEPMNMNIINNSSYDKTNNIFVKTTVDPETNDAKLDEYYYVDNDVEYRCFNKSEMDPETWETIYVPARESLDNGHINSVAFMKPADQIEVLTGAKTFDELLKNATGMLGKISLLQDTNISEAKITTKDTETGHEASIKLVASTSILGTMGVKADVTGVLKYNDERIESFVVTGTGSMTTKESKGGKDYSVVQNLTVNANIELSRAYTELIDATKVDEYKAIEATAAAKQHIKCNSIFGSENLIVKDNELTLPKKITDLQHCDVKVYKDKDHKEEVALYTLEKKSFEQEPVYVDIKPQFGYSLLIETQKDPSGFGLNTVRVKELKSINNKYEYLEKIELDSDWFGNNGKPWSEVTLNGTKVEAGSKELALESGKIYTVEYTYIAPKEEATEETK